MKTEIQKAQEVIAKEIAEQGFSTVVAKHYYYTVGFGKSGRKDLIMPAVVPVQLFRLIAGLHYNNELNTHSGGKFMVEEFKINSPSMGEEPIRCQLVEIEDQRHHAIFKETLTGEYMDGYDFVGFDIIQNPDNDNRLFGEKDCILEMKSEAILLGTVFAINEHLEKEEAEQKRVKNVLEKNQPIPRNKRKKNKNKRR